MHVRHNKIHYKNIQHLVVKYNGQFSVAKEHTLAWAMASSTCFLASFSISYWSICANKKKNEANKIWCKGTIKSNTNKSDKFLWTSICNLIKLQAHIKHKVAPLRIITLSSAVVAMSWARISFLILSIGSLSCKHKTHLQAK